MQVNLNINPTPAPWSVRDADKVVGPAGNVIAECPGYSDAAEDAAQRAQGGRESNARLIAAAPELLAACKKDVERIDHLCDMVNLFAAKLNLGNKVNAEDWTDAARAAIAKATGAAS